MTGIEGVRETHGMTLDPNELRVARKAIVRTETQFRRWSLLSIRGGGAIGVVVGNWGLRRMTRMPIAGCSETDGVAGKDEVRDKASARNN
jgi:hypothetical protein